MNNFLNFYMKHNISPVKQDISNLEKHINRRTSLYRELGIVRCAIENSDILEVAPGGGYNSIVTAMQNPKSYTLIEPNPAGYNEMLKLFREHDLIADTTMFINDMLENVKIENEFDIVLCEGLIPGLDNKQKLISKLKTCVRQGGILVITTSDEISIFLEVARRYIANKLTYEIVSIDDKLETLTKAFASHLSSLPGSSRSIRDWVLDVLINPASTSIDEYYSFVDAIRDFGKEFYYFHSSPNIFTNPTWYKQLEEEPLEYNKRYVEQFLSSWHTLFWQYADVSRRKQSLNLELSRLCLEFSCSNRRFENGEARLEDCEIEIKRITTMIQENLSGSHAEDILKDFNLLLDQTSLENIQRNNKFALAFGKGQQYVSFIKS